MRTLFLKIFLWFWLALTLVAGAAVLTAVWLPDPEMERWRAVAGDMLVMEGQDAVDVFEDDGREPLRIFLNRHPPGIQTFLFDERGKELSGQRVPPEIAKFAERIDLASPQVDVQRAGQATLAGLSVTGSGESRYKIVRSVPVGPLRGPRARQRLGPGGRPPPGGPDRPIPLPEDRIPRPPEPADPIRALLAEPGILALSLVAIGLISGAVCYGLARYLTRPVGKLQLAARRLASGDLTARVGSAIGTRRDEIADLGRDFDFMAERIESLIFVQQQLLRDISHELRSPLARLNVALEIARKSAPAAAESLHRIERESRRLDELIGQLLTLARLEAGAEVERTHVDLDQLVTAIGTDADYEAGGGNRRVVVVHLEPCAISGSPELLRRALENVVRNAIRYTAEGTQVELELRRAANERQPADGVSAGAHPAKPGGSGRSSAFAVIAVRDHGPGVPDSALNQLFRPFYRVDDARTRGTGGAGLGLAISERAVRAHGGSIRASNAIDGGLLIEIRLPIE